MTALPGTVLEQLLVAIRGVVPRAGASCYFVDADGQPFGHRLSGLRPEQLKDYRENFRQKDPYHPCLYQPATDDFVQMADATRQENSAMYLQGFLFDHGYCDEVEIFFRKPDGRIGFGIGLIQDERAGPFTRNDMDVLHKVKPFLEMILGNYLQLGSAAEDHWQQSDFVRDLTNREREIVNYLLHGASNRELAEICDVALSTVKAHLFNIFRKVGVSSRTELVTRLLAH